MNQQRTTFRSPLCSMVGWYIYLVPSTRIYVLDRSALIGTRPSYIDRVPVVFSGRLFCDKSTRDTNSLSRNYTIRLSMQPLTVNYVMLFRRERGGGRHHQ